MIFKLIIVFSCLFFIRDDIFATTNSLQLDVKDTTLDQYRFLARVSGFDICSAVLITRQHLITSAFCTTAVPNNATTVDFGKNTENYTISHTIRNYIYLNGIVVVVLEQPITDSDKIRPVKLISEEEFDLFKKDATAQLIGWFKDRQDGKESLIIDETKLLDKSSCNSLGFDEVGNEELRDDEKLCTTPVDHNTGLRIEGNVLTLHNKVAGLMVATECPSSTCNHTFIHMVPLLQWISKQVNVSVEELTGTDRTTSEAFKKIKELKQKLEFQTNNSLQESAIKIDAFNSLQAKITKIETECISGTEKNIKKMLNDIQEREHEHFNKLEERIDYLTDNLKSIYVKINKILDYIGNNGKESS